MRLKFGGMPPIARPMRTAPLAAALLLLVACADTPKGTFAKMKGAACKADTVTFFAHVDRTEVTKRVANRIVGQQANDPKTKILGKQAASDLAHAMAKKAAAEAFQGWEDDIKKGEAGDLCKMTYTGESEFPPDQTVVRWNTASGKAKAWTFEKAGDRYLVRDSE